MPIDSADTPIMTHTHQKLFHVSEWLLGFDQAVALVRAKAKAIGLLPQISPTTNDLKHRLELAGLMIPSWALDFSGTEVFVDPLSDKTIILKMRKVGYERPRDVLELLVKSQGSLDDIKHVLRECFGERLLDYSWLESDMILDIRKKGGKLSANGKLLADAELRASARQLYDDEFRERLRSSIKKPGDGRVSVGTQSHERILRQGAWLESLAADIMEEWCSKIWVGMYFGSNEIDVLGTLASRVVMIECKDSHYGLNDLTVTAKKANEIGAGVVLILTTKPLHHNVEKELATFKQSYIADCEILKVVSSTATAEIRSNLEVILKGLENMGYRQWESWDLPKDLRWKWDF